jgi:hypothetical protein
MEKDGLLNSLDKDAIDKLVFLENQEEYQMFR